MDVTIKEDLNVKINETQLRVPPDLMTFGDVLNWIETTYLRAGQCITHLYIGANEIYNYRSHAVCDRELDALENVTIYSGDFDRVVNESLAELDVELKNALTTCRDIVRLFEERAEQEAYNRLAQLLDSIRIFFTIFSEDLGWTEPVAAEISRQESSTVLERALKQLVAAQENGYWVSVCDVLEYEITPLLEAWDKLVARTREHIK